MTIHNYVSYVSVASIQETANLFPHCYRLFMGACFPVVTVQVTRFKADTRFNLQEKLCLVNKMHDWQNQTV